MFKNGAKQIMKQVLDMCGVTFQNGIKIKMLGMLDALVFQDGAGLKPTNHKSLILLSTSWNRATQQPN